MTAPLTGRRVVVTQAAHQAPELAALLQAQGAIPLLYPCIAIEPPPDTRALDAALQALAANRYDWVVLTSANTVRVLAERAGALGLPAALGAGVRLAAIGAATDEAAAALLGRRADLVPGESVAEGLAGALLGVAPAGARILLPQADIARPVLAQALAAAGLDVTPLAAYCTVAGRGGVDLPAELPTVDAITFTSSSTVRNLLRRLETEGGDCTALHRICLAAIGPVTADTLHAAGLKPTVVAQEPSLEGLVHALVDFFSRSDTD
jgi:uroporphyrinogen-III synthase